MEVLGLIMYALANWAGYASDRITNFDRTATLAVTAATAAFLGQTLILWWLGTKKDYGPYVPLTAMISALMGFIATSIIPVASSVTITAAIATTFLLNGKLRTFVLCCVEMVLISLVVVLIGSQPFGTVLGGALVGIFAALFANLTLAGLLLATTLAAFRHADRE